jgi:polyisoprenoid-binding protein YceI
MPIVTEREGEVRVFTFKEGLLSAMAHDLEIAVERFRIEWDDARTKLTATFDATSLRVLHPIVHGAPSPSSLSSRDLRKIEENIQRDVLDARKHREVRLDATSIEVDGEGHRLAGTLLLHGKSRPISATIARQGDRFVTEVTIDQREFGITPYSAMMGTLKIKPEVRVRVRVPG